MSRDELRIEREKQALHEVKNIFVSAPNILNVLDLDNDMAESVSIIKEQVSKNLERHINSGGDACEFLSLVMDRSREGLSNHFTKASDMYAPIQKLVKYIAGQVNQISMANGTAHIRRMLEFYEQADCEPIGSNDNKRHAMSLTYLNSSEFAHNGTDQHSNAGTIEASEDGEADKQDSDIEVEESCSYDSYAHLEYTGTLCIIETNPEESEQWEAYAQAHVNACNIYTCQHNRQFVWALTVCGSVLRICLFTNDKMFVSDALDLSRKGGRSSLVEFIARASFCNEYHLGYDPTIRYNKDIDKWQVDIFSDGKAEPKTLILDSVLHIATRTTGRHTRCFICTDPDSNEQLLVKDAWAEETKRPELAEVDGDEDTAAVSIEFKRDEVSLLKEVHEVLGKEEMFKRCYPVLKYGGVVRQNLTNSQSSAIIDTTYSAFAKIGPVLQSDQVPYRVHKRMASTPIASSLRNLCSVDEYIVVMADAMITLWYIAKNCGILHRDISSNNIMFTRDEDGTVRGFLNDFDCAIKTSVDRIPRTTMTGTLPFMSICNLEDRQIDQTILNDLESCIYHMCWFGIEGVCSSHERNAVNDYQTHLGGWRIGSPKKVAEEKISHMDSDRSFRNRVTSLFIGADKCETHEDEHVDCKYKLYGYDRLASLVCRLREALFENKKLSRKCWGTYNLLADSSPPSDRVFNMSDDDRFGNLFAKNLKKLDDSKNASTFDMESSPAADSNEDPDFGPDPFANRALDKCREIIAQDIINIMIIE
ncbi:hypothetical protein FB639_002173, partial [Coemansia asiatica]